MILTYILTKVRLLKSPLYEGRLANFATIFADRCKELKFGLLMFVAIGVAAINHTLAGMHDIVRGTQKQMDLLFRKLDTPHERELLEYISSKGGHERCSKDDVALRGLVEMLGLALK